MDKSPERATKKADGQRKKGENKDAAELEDKSDDDDDKKVTSPAVKQTEKNDAGSVRATDTESIAEDEGVQQKTPKRTSKRTKKKSKKTAGKTNQRVENEIERNAEGQIAKPSNFSVYRSWSAIPEINVAKIATLKVRVTTLVGERLY